MSVYIKYELWTAENNYFVSYRWAMIICDARLRYRLLANDSVETEKNKLYYWHFTSAQVYKTGGRMLFKSVIPYNYTLSIDIEYK